MGYQDDTVFQDGDDTYSYEIRYHEPGAVEELFTSGSAPNAALRSVKMQRERAELLRDRCVIIETLLTHRCDDCNGDGFYTSGDVCDTCGGLGYIEDDEDI